MKKVVSSIEKGPPSMLTRPAKVGTNIYLELMCARHVASPAFALSSGLVQL